MSEILKLFGFRFPSRSSKSSQIIDDFSDRLHHRITTTTLIVLSIVITTQKFVGSTIDCWVPAHFSFKQLEYTNDFCWIQNTYYLPEYEDVPRHDERVTIPYYQWVAIILLVQAFMFYTPYLVWTAVNHRIGIDIQHIVRLGDWLRVTEMMGYRDAALSLMVEQMDRYLTSINLHQRYTSKRTQRRHTLTGCLPNIVHSRYDNNLCITYVVVKLLYFINVIGQFFLLDRLLGFNFHGYGLDLIRAARSGTVSSELMMSRFPRTAMCDLKIRRLGNVHRYSVECVLSTNLFNEKIFTFLWFWFVLLAAITGISLVVWILRLFHESARRQYVKRHLNYRYQNNNFVNLKKLAQFVNTYLRNDGIFILWMVGCNTDAITVTELMSELWKNFRKKPRSVECAKMNGVTRTDETGVISNNSDSGLPFDNDQILETPCE